MRNFVCALGLLANLVNPYPKLLLNQLPFGVKENTVLMYSSTQEKHFIWLQSFCSFQETIQLEAIF